MNNQQKNSRATYFKHQGDCFVVRFSRSRADKKGELRKLIMAHSDVYNAYEISAHFLEIVKPGSKHQTGSRTGMDHPLYTALLSSIIVSYSKPFTNNKGFGILGKKWTKFPHPRLAEAHARILRARNELYAHSDAEVRHIRIHPPGESKFLDGATMVGVGYAIRGYALTYNEVRIIAELSSDLARRLRAEVERLLKELYDGLELPNRDFALRLDDGL